MKNFLLIILSITIFSCADNTSKQSEFQEGIVEMNDSKSQAMDNFTKAYLENNLETQIDLFTEDAVIHINSNDVSPAQMIEEFSRDKEFYENVENIERATATMTFEDGDVYSNYWFTWKATSKSTGVTITNPVHSWFKWDGDKVSEGSFIFDPTEYVANMPQ